MNAVILRSPIVLGHLQDPHGDLLGLLGSMFGDLLTMWHCCLRNVLRMHYVIVSHHRHIAVLLVQGTRPQHEKST
eukprot:377725-Pyramimonas_sp.AAC.1